MTTRTEYTYEGHDIRVGQTYRDAHRSVPRTLRVTGIEEPWFDGAQRRERCAITLDVLGVDGRVLRTVSTEARRLVGNDFVQATQ